MLADLEDPPKSRLKGFLIGIAIATPVALLFFGYVLPTLYGMIMGGAASADERIEMESAYMRGVCQQAMVLPRDKALCECALASEVPGIDCRFVFDAWTMLRQAEQCESKETFDSAITFCSCVNELHKLHGAAVNDKERREIVSRYRRCVEFPDALFLPTIEVLIEKRDQAKAESQ